MLDLLRDLSGWITDFADSDWAALVVAINAFTESIFNPIPPDPLLIAIGIKQPELAIWMAALTTVASVLGAIVGVIGTLQATEVFQRVDNWCRRSWQPPADVSGCRGRWQAWHN